jgi:hypothetical protein
MLHVSVQAHDYAYVTFMMHIYMYIHMRLYVHVYAYVSVFMHVQFVCMHINTTKDVGTGSLPDLADAVRHLFGPVPD